MFDKVYDPFQPFAMDIRLKDYNIEEIEFGQLHRTKPKEGNVDHSKPPILT